MPSRFSAILAAVLLTAAPVQASTFVNVFNFSWTGTWSFSGSGSPDAAGLWGITASSEFINPYPDLSERFDPANGAFRVEGRVDIIGDVGSGFSRNEVIGLSLNVISADVRSSDVPAPDYRIQSYSLLKENLRIGIMNGSIVEDSFGIRGVDLTAFRLMQKIDPSDPTQKFEQIFGCPTINDGCGGATYVPPLPAYDSGNPVPPSAPFSTYGVVVLTDGRSDPCCGARSNALRFFYETPEQALASFQFSWDRENSYTLTGPAPEGLPQVPLPAGLPLLLGALAGLGLATRRVRGAAASQG